jgi:hypothetical protein
MLSTKDGILLCSPLAFLQIVHMSILLFLLLVSSQRQQEGLPFRALVTQHLPMHHPKNLVLGFPLGVNFFG